MPKNRKAKAKASDFQKVRHKVGRKVPLAANATNTNIKAKRIALPGAPGPSPPPPSRRHAAPRGC